jgi:hypothetical protein
MKQLIAIVAAMSASLAFAQTKPAEPAKQPAAAPAAAAPAAPAKKEEAKKDDKSKAGDKKAEPAKK